MQDLPKWDLPENYIGSFFIELKRFVSFGEFTFTSVISFDFFNRMRDHLETNDSKIWMLILRLNFVILSTFKKFEHLKLRGQVDMLWLIIKMKTFTFWPQRLWSIRPPIFFGDLLKSLVKVRKDGLNRSSNFRVNPKNMSIFKYWLKMIYKSFYY